MPSKLHSRIQIRLATLLEINYGTKYNMFSELSLALAEWASVPDLAIYPAVEIDFSEDETQITTPPLCAIEILSPSQSFYELIAKADKYFQHGLQSCWLVIPVLKNIYVFTSREHYEIYRFPHTLEDPALGISIDLKEVFR